MKGGLKIKDEYTINTAFRHFVENSDITYMTKGSFGIIFKCKLKDGIESPYTNLRTIYKDKEVRNIIIKFSLVHHDDRYEFNLESGGSFEISSVHAINGFKDEVKKQVEIFNTTKDKLDPICPSIIYNEYLDERVNKNNYMRDTMGIIYTSISSIKNNNNDMLMRLFDNLLIKVNSSSNYSFGLIGMEMMGDYVTLASLIGTINYNLYEDMAKLRLIELAVKTGYSHNDFHRGNILVNPNATGYYIDKGHVVLIDFGYTKKIDPILLKQIKKDYTNNDLYHILYLFYTDPILYNPFPGGGGFFFKDYPHLYQWITTFDPKYINLDPKYSKYASYNNHLVDLKDEYDDNSDRVCGRNGVCGKVGSFFGSIFTRRNGGKKTVRKNNKRKNNKRKKYNTRKQK